MKGGDHDEAIVDSFDSDTSFSWASPGVGSAGLDASSLVEAFSGAASSCVVVEAASGEEADAASSVDGVSGVSIEYKSISNKALYDGS